MASPPCFFSSQIRVSFKVDRPRLPSNIPSPRRMDLSRTFAFAPREMVRDLFGKELKQCICWSFVGGSETIGRPNHARISTDPGRNTFAVNAAWQLSSEVVADIAFTVGTVAVLPFYTCMVVAPQAGILPGIAKMFSSEMTLASAWIHLLTVDLFAARQVYRDGLLNEVETRHSVILCLLFCPVGILVHLITKALSRQNRRHGIQ